MKRLFVIAGLIFTGMAANAQVYAGGSFNMDGNSTKNNDGEKQTTTFSIGLQPEIGYYLTDRCDVGASLRLGYTGDKDHTTDTKTETTNWRLSPFIRYALFQIGKFEVIERTNVFIGGAKNGAGTKTFNAGAGITPILAYNLNDRLALQTELNFVSVGLTYSKVKDGNSTVNSNIGFNADNLLNVGGITIGFRYKF
ncbi:MAG: outer membrane beta-barrel protein [Bacteroidales bacterium]|nr:outer membrane beta-barrel protein [Bacteroidales bacterium]